MPDIQLRFDKDMLVLSAPVDAVLARQGVDVERDREFLSLIEPEAVRDVLRLESIAGAQCLVTNTAGITAARLAHVNMEDRGLELAAAALTIIKSLRPQHVIAEIGPTGLPLDQSSAASLKQNRNQYAQAARDFGSDGVDALFLNGFTSTVDLQCALMGVRMVTDIPVFASVDVDEDGNLVGRNETVEDACSVMAEYEASVVGFSTAAELEQACSLACRMKTACSLPLLVQLEVGENNPKQGDATATNPYYCADVMVEAASRLRGVGAQFLRAAGNATPAYTGALVAASAGFDVVGCGSAHGN
ncbi:MAG: homocysteine S-methyltransferase family protein [Raoultibacter sp.]